MIDTTLPPHVSPARLLRTALTFVAVVVTIAAGSWLATYSFRAGTKAGWVQARATDARIRSTETALMSHRYLYVAYALWAERHPDGACPQGIEDLVGRFTGQFRFPREDAWGQPYALHCDSVARQISLRSNGPDHQPGTKDDLWTSRPLEAGRP